MKMNKELPQTDFFSLWINFVEAPAEQVIASLRRMAEENEEEEGDK